MWGWLRDLGQDLMIKGIVGKEEVDKVGRLVHSTRPPCMHACMHMPCRSEGTTGVLFRVSSLIGFFLHGRCHCCGVICAPLLWYRPICRSSSTGNSLFFL